jgi:hypothetical protein
VTYLLATGSVDDSAQAFLFAAIRVAQAPECVGIGWESAEVRRYAAENEVRAKPWPDEQSIEYIETFFNEGSVRASRLLRDVGNTDSRG